MMSECKRILNKEVAGEGLWQTDLSKCQGQQEGEVLEIRAADEEDHPGCNHGTLFRMRARQSSSVVLTVVVRAHSF